MSRHSPTMTRAALAVLEFIEDNPGCKLNGSQANSAQTLITRGLIVRTEVAPHSRYEAVQIEVRAM